MARTPRDEKPLEPTGRSPAQKRKRRKLRKGYLRDYEPSKQSQRLHEQRMGFTPFEQRPQLRKLNRVGDGKSGNQDPESVFVEDVFPFLEEYSNAELARWLDVDESRIRRMKKQKRISFAIADELLTRAGVSYLMGNQIRVRNAPAGVPKDPDQSDDSGTPADAPE